MIVPQSSDIDKQKALPDVPATAGSSRVSPSPSAAPGTAVGSLSLQPPPYEPGSGASSSQQQLRQAENSAAYAQQPLSSPRAFAAPPSPSPSHSHFPYSPDPNAISHSTAINAGPPSFSRLPSQEPAYPVFPPMCLLASGKYLTKGFPAVPPPSKVEYHPFTTHDITQEDWQRYDAFAIYDHDLPTDNRECSFIQDLNKAAELKAKEVDQAWSLPIISWFPYINNVAAIAFKTHTVLISSFSMIQITESSKAQEAGASFASSSSSYTEMLVPPPTDSKDRSVLAAHRDVDNHDRESIQPPPYEPGAGSSSSAYASQVASTSTTPESSNHPANYRPPAFSRLPSQGSAHSYSTFGAMFLLASSKSIAKGFPVVPPPSMTQPHPFSTHDVLEDEWKSFVNDLNRVAEVTEKDVEPAWGIPIVSWVPAVAMAYKAHLKKKRAYTVNDRLYEWNHYFFHPRRIDVALFRGHHKVGKAHESTKGDCQACEKDKDCSYRLWVQPLGD
ncbi:hypothetical protein ONZ45_g5662 [Pleurotus djamor]|nr:hypothetical protein ONZ45_g5662 [Pleurotus djamor]